MSSGEFTQASDYAGLHRSFAETIYGQGLSERVRFAKYKPDQVDNQRWQQLLGIDVNNLGHLQLSGNIMRLLIREIDATMPEYELSQPDKLLLTTAAYVHDWPEYVVGDIHYGDKTADDEAEEASAFKENLENFLPDARPETVALILASIDDVISKDGEKHLHAVFDVMEKIGYVRTALRAAEHCELGDAEECENGLRWLVGDVLSNQIIKLIEYSDTFIPVRTYLTNKSEAISSAFAVVDDDIFWNYPTEQMQRKVNEFRLSTLAWNSWRAKA